MYRVEKLGLAVTNLTATTLNWQYDAPPAQARVLMVLRVLNSDAPILDHAWIFSSLKLTLWRLTTHIGVVPQS